MVKEIKNVVTWLKNWFYDKTEVYAKTETYSKEEVNTALGNKVNVAQGSGNSDKNVVTNSSGNITTEPKVSAGSGLSLSNANQMNHSNSVTAQTSAVFKKVKYDAQGHITGTANVTSSDLPSHSHTIANVTNLQNELNGLDTRLDNLESIKTIEVVSTLPTASAGTMGKLYIISENSKVNVYYTEQSGSGSSATYSWHKMDTDILDDLSVDWSEIENNPFSNSTPSSFANSSHAHGGITNDGAFTGSTEAPEINNFPDSADYFLIADRSDSWKIKGTRRIFTEYVEDFQILNNIGITTSGTQQKNVNKAIDTKIGQINSSLSGKITSIALVPKGSDPTADAYNGVIRLYYGDEPSS